LSSTTVTELATVSRTSRSFSVGRQAETPTYRSDMHRLRLSDSCICCRWWQD